MSFSFIEFKDKGFWVNDGFIMAAINFVMDAIEGEHSKSPWLVELYDSFGGISKGYSIGTASLNLDYYLNEISKINLFCAILEKTIDTLKIKGDVIPMDEINSHLRKPNEYGGFTGDIDTYLIVGIVKGIQKVILEEAGDFDFHDFHIHEKLGKQIMDET